MSANLETVARQKFAAVLASSAEIEQLDVTANMRDAYGLTSLNKILFITSLCQEMDISLAGLTEDDLGRMNSLDDVIRILAPLADAPAASHLQGA